MSGNTDVIQGALKLLGEIKGVRWESFEAFVKWFVESVAVEVPRNIGNIVVQNVEPDATKRDCIWFRQNAAGNFIGLFVYGGGDWHQILPAPQQITRMYGDSSSLPAGYALADQNVAGISAAMDAHLKTQWHSNGAGGYDIFDTVFLGF